MKRIRMVLSGRVQGVNFRNFAVREADALELKGYVKNLNDGTVEIIAEGNSEKLNEFIKRCRKGPLLAFVQNIKIADEPVTEEFEDFNVRY